MLMAILLIEKPSADPPEWFSAGQRRCEPGQGPGRWCLVTAAVAAGDRRGETRPQRCACPRAWAIVAASAFHCGYSSRVYVFVPGVRLGVEIVVARTKFKDKCREAFDVVADGEFFGHAHAP
jgi:hypothetical protein